jgi:hypothetical protein
MELLLSICLIVTPTQCRNERLLVTYESVGPVVCIVTAQQSIAQWQSINPQWRVVKWKCRPTLRGAGRLI